jgi:DNA-binding beta-propeller fold protein YncE
MNRFSLLSKQAARHFSTRQCFFLQWALLTTLSGCLTAIFLTSNGKAEDKIVLVAGGDNKSVDVLATEARLAEPFGLAFDSQNLPWIIEMASGNRLLKIDQQGILSHVAGKTEKGFSGDGGKALDAQFNGPHNLAIRPNGQILIGDTWNGRVRQVDPKLGMVTSLPGYEVPIEKAKNSGPYCITIDFTGTQLYIADLTRIQRLDLETGVLSLVAGNGKKGVPHNGALATESPLSDPRAVAPDRLGNVYILERGGNALRVVSNDGTIQTVVGAIKSKETPRDMKLNGPKHICVDLMNRVVIADAENHLIRRYDPSDGSLTRIAGTGKMGHQGVGGSPLDCQLARPHGVTVHPETGELYITDSYNNRILKIVSDSK